MGKEFAAPTRTANTSRRAFVLATALQALASTIGRAEQSANAPGSGVRTIALPEFVSATSDLRDVAHEMTNVVAEDLKATGQFALPDSSAWEGITNGVDTVPPFERWRAAGAQLLITGRVKASDKRLSSECRLWDVENGRQLLGMTYFSGPENWRRVADEIAARIAKAILGEKQGSDDR